LKPSLSNSFSCERAVAIEPASGGGTYYPNGRLNEPYGKFRKAFGTAINKEWREELGM